MKSATVDQMIVSVFYHVLTPKETSIIYLNHFGQVGNGKSSYQNLDYHKVDIWYKIWNFIKRLFNK